MTKLFSQSGTLVGSPVALDPTTAFGDDYGVEVMIINKHPSNIFTFIDTKGQSHTIPSNRGLVLPVEFRYGTINGTGDYQFYASTKAGFVERRFDTGVADGAVDTAQLAPGAVTTAKIDGEAVAGANIANVADSQTSVGSLVLLPFLLPSGANAFVSKTIDEKLEVIDFVCWMKGAGTGGSGIGVDDGTDAITDFIDVASASDKDVFRASTIDDSKNVVAASGVVRVGYSSAGANFPGAFAMVTCIKRA